MHLLVLLEANLGYIARCTQVYWGDILLYLRIIAGFMGIIIQEEADDLPESEGENGYADKAGDDLTDTLLLQFLLHFLMRSFYLVVFVLFHCYILIDYYLMIPLLFYLIQLSGEF